MTRSVPSIHTRQRGQALAFSLITVSIVILVMFAMYAMGQQTITKMRLQNTADASAYSAAQAQARDYNFSAYTNRAMIANQVAVAQMVGLTSWARNYGNTYSGKFSWVPNVLNSLGSPMAAMWSTPWDINESLSSGFRDVLNVAGPVATTVLDVLIDALGLSQQVYHYGTALTIAQTLGLDVFGPTGVLAQLGVDTTSDILTLKPAYNIIKLNDAKAQLSLPGELAVAIGLGQWLGFTENKDPNLASKDGGGDGDSADRFANVTLASLDKFSRDRSTRDGWYNGAPEAMYLTPEPFLVDPTRFIPFQDGAFLMFLWHRGGTELKLSGVNKDKKLTWSAMDATGFFGGAIIWIPVLFVPVPIPIIVPTMPIGWGAAQAGASDNLNSGNNVGTSSGAYGGVYDHFMTGGAAMLQKSEGAGTPLGSLPSSGGGLRKYFDVKDLKADNLAAPPWVIEIEKSAADLPGSPGSGQLSLTNGTQSDYMRALSKSQVYFSRPAKLPAKLWPRADGKTELGSLYSPYWQTRLLPNTFAEQFISMSWQLGP